MQRFHFTPFISFYTLYNHLTQALKNLQYSFVQHQSRLICGDHGIDLLPFPHTETWDWCPGIDFIYSNVLTLDLLVLEIRQVSMSPGSMSDSSHQLLEPKHILHSHLYARLTFCRQKMRLTRPVVVQVLLSVTVKSP